MSNKSPLVSVCIPAYNHEKYVGNCIKSIIAQTYKNIEFIMIDDGSRDNTYQEIKKLLPKIEKRFVRVHVDTQPNAGTCKTMNKLYGMARGKYIYDIASDDAAKPDAIETLVNFMEKNPDYALAVGDNEIIDSKGKRAFWGAARNNVYDKSRAVWKTFGDFLKSQNKNVDFNSKCFGTYSTLSGGNYIPNGALIRHDILKKVGPFTPDAPLEDWWFMMQISKYAKIKYIDLVLYSYRWHGNNTIKQTDKMQQFAKQTERYEKRLLANIDVSTVLPDVRKFIRQQHRREFIHRFIYHRYRVGDTVVYKILGFLKFSYHK